MPIVNAEMLDALSEAQGVSPEKAMAAAAIIGQLEKRMLARSSFSLVLRDMVPMMLGSIIGLQIVILIVLMSR